MVDRNEDRAQENFSWLQNNPYPGRGIVVGLSDNSAYMIQVYWIMGRRENSRNRIFKFNSETGRLYTEAADPTKVKDPSLIIYNAMQERDYHYIVSNGDQTDTVADSLAPMLLHRILAGRQYEPDGPNYAQRITAVSSLIGNLSSRIQMSILRKSIFGLECDRLMYEYIPHPGFGYCITTYSGDGDPLPSFRGDPLLMPLRGDAVNVLKTYWDALNSDNRVSIAVKFIERSTGLSHIEIINKNDHRA